MHYALREGQSVSLGQHNEASNSVPFDPENDMVIDGDELIQRVDQPSTAATI